MEAKIIRVDNMVIWPIEESSISVSPATKTLKVDETQQLTVSFTPEQTTDKSVSFASDDETVATVSDSWLITAKKEGEATITATSHLWKTATAVITVEAKEETPETPADDSGGEWGDWE